MRFDLVICDVDGCLADERGGDLDLPRLARLAELNRAAERGEPAPRVTLCTGRPLPFAEALARLIACHHTPLVAENGVWLYHPATNRYERDPAISADHIDAVHAAARLLEERLAPRGFSQQPGKTCSVTLFHPQRERLVEVQDEVRGLLDDRGWPFRVSMTWDYINCDLRHVSKATGVARLLGATGIASSRVAGIGDTSSDIPLAESTAWFGCPANASDAIKAHADYVSPHEQAAGVVDILRVLAEAPGPSTAPGG